MVPLFGRDELHREELGRSGGADGPLGWPAWGELAVEERAECSRRHAAFSGNHELAHAAGNQLLHMLARRPRVHHPPGHDDHRQLMPLMQV